MSRPILHWESETKRVLYHRALGKVASIWCFAEGRPGEPRIWHAAMSKNLGAIDGLMGRYEQFKTEDEAHVFVRVWLAKKLVDARTRRRRK